MKKFLLAIVAVAAIAFGSLGVTKDDYGKYFSVTVGASIGEKTATDVVLPIRLTAAISGLDLADFEQTDGSDMIILDGQANALPYEIEEWNVVGKSAVIWVKVPSVSAGTVLTIYYKGPKNTDNVPSAVWNNYLGVWHLGDGTVVSGQPTACADSTANGRNGASTPRTSISSGFFGKARRTRTSNYNNANVGGVFLPSMELKGAFAISGWFKQYWWGKSVMMSTKGALADQGFLLAVMNGNAQSQIEAVGDTPANGWNSVKWTAGTLMTSWADWNHFVYVADGQNNIYVYINGQLAGKAPSAASVTDVDRSIALGCMSTDDCFADTGTPAIASFAADIDEARIQSYDNFSADRLAIEIGIARDNSALSYSSVTEQGGLSVNMTYTCVQHQAPAEVEYVAEIEGASGEVVY